MHDSSELKDSRRFDLRQRLGSGGMGVVYSAYDRQRRELVALKVLHTSDASALYRFKKEFRSLADVVHPNLVSLYELVAEDGQWFFTMEIVDGVSFFDYVRPAKGSREVGSGADDSPAAPANDQPVATESGWQEDGRVGGMLDPDRLRHALRQLVEAVQALHDAGKLHRDLKPPNVMVEHDGRLVILDFGLVTDLELHRQTLDSGLAGTVAYMAPEQAKSEPATPASDWYAVGVILFQALTGRLPFIGSLYEVLVGKQEKPAPSPADLVPELPIDLVRLCERLLSVAPQDRPTGPEILELLGRDLSEVTTSSIPIVREGFNIGRDEILAVLDEAVGRAGAGEATSVYIHGASGMGKTALIDTFLDDQMRHHNALVLRGRCAERETVPYKALDGVIDSLSRYLTSLSDSQVSDLLPERFQALMRLFPVLRRIFPLPRVPRPQPESPDLLILRQQAFTALRQLLGNIAAERPVLLFIDDLQWADAESAGLLGGLLAPPDAPPLVLLAGFRTEEIERRPFLAELLARTGTEACRQIEVETLSDGAARELAVSLLAPAEVGEKVLSSIVKEAHGSPFLIEQMARFVGVNHEVLTTGLSLVEMLEERMRQLPSGARQMLLTMAVANRPINATVAYRAARLEGDPRSLVASLRGATFVRTSGSAQRIELYHDRIRTALVSLIDAFEIRRIHLRLAEALEAQGVGDPEALFEHYLAADDEPAAARCAVAAAEKAFNALAFEPAARFYRRAVELMPGEDERRGELLRGLARSLANAGRSSQSASVYLDLAVQLPDQALEARCRAAEQYLLGGYLDRGLMVARAVLSAVGLEMARGPKRALVSLIINRLRLRLRGLEFVARDAADIPERDLVRIDTCWAVTNGLSLADAVRGTDFQTRHLLLALEAGEPYRVARALAMEGSFLATTGNLERAERIRDRAMELAREVDHPHALGLATMQVGMVAYFKGEWRAASKALAEAHRIFRDRCRNVVWEMTMCRRFSIASHTYLGEIHELRQRLPLHLSETKERGDTYLSNAARARTMSWLASDEVATALRYLEGEEAKEAAMGFTIRRYNELLARVQADLYRGEPRAVWHQLSERWPQIRRSLLLRVRLARVEALQARARVALANAAQGYETRSLLRIVKRYARRIARTEMPWAEPMSALLLAGAARVQGEHRDSRRLLRSAEQGFEAAEMKLYAAVARRRLGELSTGGPGDEMIEQADTWMGSQGIVRPDRMTAMLAPGFEDTSCGEA
ncbi:MAG: AAA family ATPase [Acidobacteriota bacterium]